MILFVQEFPLNKFNWNWPNYLIIFEKQVGHVGQVGPLMTPLPHTHTFMKMHCSFLEGCILLCSKHLFFWPKIKKDVLRIRPPIWDEKFWFSKIFCCSFLLRSIFFVRNIFFFGKKSKKMLSKLFHLSILGWHRSNKLKTVPPPEIWYQNWNFWSHQL